MKNKGQYIAVIILSVLHVYSVIRGIEFFKYYFSSFDNGFRWSNLADTIQNTFYVLNLLFDFTLVVVFFTSTGTYQDKVYRLLRYVFLITFFLYFPYSLYSYLSPDSYFYQMPLLQKLLTAANTAIYVTCVVFFLRSKPASQPAKVNLAEYELVNYTATGHRFVHYLLDVLFIIPIFLFWKQFLTYRMGQNSYVLQALFTLIYLVYCFLSELMFRQTLGKIATRSCVTTIGYSYSGGRMLLRTLARLIPFDRFSFLWGANWHDKTTSTAVVSVDTWEKAFVEETPAEEEVRHA